MMDRRFHRLAQVFLITILAISFVGCGRVGENTINEILTKDPPFQKLWNAKKNLDAKILSLKNETSFLKAELTPAIQGLRADLEKVGSEYKIKKEELKLSLSKLKNIRKLLQQKGELSLSGDEINIWNKRASDFEKEINSLRAELDKLQSKIQLLRTEIRILKQ